MFFVCNLMIDYSKKIKENYRRKCFWTREKKTRVKSNPGLALIGPRTTGP